MDGTAVDLVPIAHAMLDGAATILLAVGSAWIRNRKLSSDYKDVLENALQNGVGMAKAYADPKIDTYNVLLHPDIRNKPIAAGVQYVIDHAGEAVNWFDLSPDKIADKLTARMGLTSATSEPMQAELMTSVPPTLNLSLMLDGVKRIETMLTAAQEPPAAASDAPATTTGTAAAPA